MRDTAKFLKLLEKQNADIAARQLAIEEGVDPVRLERDAERREKWGTLRARAHSRGKTRQVSNVFPHVDVSN